MALQGTKDSDESIGVDPCDKNGGVTPMVYLSANGDLQVLLYVEGINCAQCAKMLETILQGYSRQSSTPGLLDAVADRGLQRVLLRIDDARHAPRIAHEAARQLTMVGYKVRTQDFHMTATTTTHTTTTMECREDVCVEIVQQQQQEQGSSVNFFDWSARCTCSATDPLVRHTCARHEQMTSALANLLSTRYADVKQRWRVEHEESDQQPEPEEKDDGIFHSMAEANYGCEPIPRRELREDAEMHSNPDHDHRRNNRLLYRDPLPSVHQFGGLQQQLYHRQPTLFDHNHRETNSLEFGFVPVQSFDSMEKEKVQGEDWEPEPFLY